MVASNDAERQALRGVPWFRNKVLVTPAEPFGWSR